MEIEVITELNDKTLFHLKRLAELMVGADELEFAVFYSQLVILQNDGGKLLSAKIDGEIIGYIFFSQCVDADDAMKLYYIAIENKYRKQGYGTKLVLDSMKEMGKEFYMLCCLPKLKKFYENLDFIFVQKSLYDNTICMVSKHKDMNKARMLPKYNYYQPSIPPEWEADYSKIRAHFE